MMIRPSVDPHLCFVLMPFTTSLVGEFTAFRTALLVYWGNIVLLGVGIFAAWDRGFRAGLIHSDALVQQLLAVEAQ